MKGISPVDVRTEAGRNRERYRRAALATLSSVLAKGALLAVLFASTRVGLTYLGEARFGVLVTILSLTTALSFLDFGVGNSVVSRIAAHSARSEIVAMRRLIGVALCVLTAVGVVIGGLIACAAAVMPIAWLYKGASPALVAEARVSLAVFGALFGLSMPLQAVHRIYAGLQKAHLGLIVSSVMSAVSLVLLPFLPRWHAGIADFLLVTYGLQVVSGAILLAGLHARLGLSPPRLTDFRGVRLHEIASAGALFFVLQVTTALAWDMDAVLLSILLGPASAATYYVVQRMFLLVTGPLSMLNAPLWGAYAHAHAHGDVAFIRTTLRRSLVGTFALATCGAVVVVIVNTPLVRLLAGGAVDVPFSLVLVFAIWTVLSTTGEALAMYLNGLHVVRPQVVVAVCFLFVALTLKLPLTASYGVTGIIAATVVAYLITTVTFFGTVFRRALMAPLQTVTRQ